MDSKQDEKSLELRIAAIEDKLSRLVQRAQSSPASGSMASGMVSTALSPQLCSFCYHCVISISIPVSIPVHTTGIAQQTTASQPAASSGFGKLGQ
jgi:hypothetical protein